MKKILVYHGKHDPEYFDASTKELEGEAYRKLFKLLDSYGYYTYTENDLKRFDKGIDESQKNIEQLEKLEQTKDIAKLLEKSKSSFSRYSRYKQFANIEFSNYTKIKNDVDNVDTKIIRRFLYSRTSYEYESFTFDNVS